MSFEIREARMDDLDFLVQADIATDAENTDEEVVAHRGRLALFVMDAAMAE